MKFTIAAVAALMLSTPVNSFHVGKNGNISTKESIVKASSATDRRSFFSAASLIVGGVGLLPPSQPANAAYYNKDGNKVDVFGKPIPLYESLSERSKARVDGKEIEVTAKEDSKDDSKLLADAKAETKEQAAKEEQERIEAEELRLEEIRLSKERVPPEVPRVLVLGGTGTVGKEVRSKLEAQGFFVVATSRDGRGNTVELDVTKCYGKVEKEVYKLARENKCSAVVSLIGGVGSENDGLINGATGQAALAASNVQCVRNFVAIGPSTSIIAKVPKGLESYVKAKQLSQEIVMNTFKPDPKREGMSYTIINPGAIGKSKNYGSDPSVPLETIVNAVVVGATGFYLGESSAVLDSVEDINSKASKISKVKELKA
jgi:hypothetical protein